MIYYVNCKATIPGNGSQGSPFKTIQQAAAIARPGDEVRVLPGVYRESVNPVYGGTLEARIVYRSVEKGGAVITGAERVENWEALGDNVWKASVPNSLFSDRNPFTTLVGGDWFIPMFPAHTGDVYLNGKSLYEVGSLDAVRHPEPAKLAWDQEFSTYTWYAEQDEANPAFKEFVGNALSHFLNVGPSNHQVYEVPEGTSDEIWPEISIDRDSTDGTIYVTEDGNIDD